MSPRMPPSAPTAIDRLNVAFKDLYAARVKERLGQIADVIVVESSPDGGTYRHYRHGEMHRETSPVPPRFRTLKSIAHGPTSLVAVGADSQADARLAEAARAALAELPSLNLGPEAEPLARRALEFTIENIDAPPVAFPAEIAQTCEDLITLAGVVQAHACHDLLRHWRTDMGEARWSQAHAIVGTGWGLKEHGTHFEVLLDAFGRDALNVRFFADMGEKTPELLLRRLGTILANRATCTVVFGDPRRMDTELLGDAVCDALRGQPQPR